MIYRIILRSSGAFEPLSEAMTHLFRERLGETRMRNDSLERQHVGDAAEMNDDVERFGSLG